MAKNIKLNPNTIILIILALIIIACLIVIILNISKRNDRINNNKKNNNNNNNNNNNKKPIQKIDKTVFKLHSKPTTIIKQVKRDIKKDEDYLKKLIKSVKKESNVSGNSVKEAEAEAEENLKISTTSEQNLKKEENESHTLNLNENSKISNPITDYLKKLKSKKEEDEAKPSLNADANANQTVKLPSMPSMPSIPSIKNPFARRTPQINNNVTQHAINLANESSSSEHKININSNLIPDVSNAVPPIVHSPEQEIHNINVIKPMEGIGNAGSQNEINNLTQNLPII